MKAKHIVTVAMAGILATGMVAFADIEGNDRQQNQRREQKHDGKHNRRSRAGKNGQRPPMGMLLGKIATNPKMAEKLGISDEQVAAIKEAITGSQTEQKSLREKMKEVVKGQLELMQAEEVDEAALMIAVEETGRIRTDIAKLNIKNMLAIKNILTPEQVAKIKGFMQKRMGKGREHEGRDGKRDKRKNRDNQGERGMGQGLQQKDEG